MRILIVDDEPRIRASLEGLLSDEGHTVSACDSAELGLAALAEEPFDAVLLDVMLPGMNGLDALERIHRSTPEVKVLMMSGHSDIATAVRAVKAGAHQFLEKPVDPDRLLVELRNLALQKSLERKVASLESEVETEADLIGESEPMVRLRQAILKAAPTESRVLITGENGTGKELVARRVHRESLRRDRPFVSLNCAALPQTLVESELFGYEKGAFTGATARKRGLIETAEGGTLFLDEIGDMAPDTQAKLLRVLEQNEAVRVGGTVPVRFDVRIIAATNKNLNEEIASGRFREDLYYRLNVVPIEVPPLRLRGKDVGLLAARFLESVSGRMGKGMMRWEQKALESLHRYAWPGNVRELKNFTERMAIMAEGGIVTALETERALQGPGGGEIPQGAPAEYDESLSFSDNAERYEKRILNRKFQEAKGNVSLLARMLKTDRANLHRKLKAYGIK